MRHVARPATWAIALAFLVVATFTTPPVAVGQHGGALTLRHAGQVIRIDDPHGNPRLSVLVETDQGDVAVFDGEMPLIRGANFDLQPEWARANSRGSGRAGLVLGGTHETHGYDWTLQIEAHEASLPIRFELTCHLLRPLLLQGLEPSVLFQRSAAPEDLVKVDQGPGNIYAGPAEAAWGNSFPAAYIWMDGTEAAFLVDGGSMRWTSPKNIFRFHDYRARSVTDGGALLFGLDVVKRNFHELPAGDMTITFHLAVRRGVEPPDRLDALDRLMMIAGPLHPAESAPPRGGISWRAIAEGVARDLSLRDICWTMVELPADRPWRDGPAFLDRTVGAFPVSTDYAVDSACIDRLNRVAVDAWDFSTCNNYLSGWMAWLASHHDADQQSLVDGKLAILPAFYDPETALVRHGIRHADRVGVREMCWQNFMFHIEMARVHHLMPAPTFDPAVGGRFLMSLRSLAELARNEGYNFPQWFDPTAKAAAIQQDAPELGIIREPWQAGSYAWIMCQAHRMTGDVTYLEEARMAIESLFTRLEFTIENTRYRMDYADPVDFPITEIFGNVWGMPACLYIFHETGDERYRRWGRDFRNSLLRMTYGYESDLRDDAKDQALQNLGLFRNHSGAFTGSPWESSEAILGVAEYLRLSEEPDIHLLKVLNSYRNSAFSFFPVAMDPVVMPCKRFADHPAQYLPVEDFYMLEHGGAHGGMGRCIYMAGAAFWNQQLFDGGAEARPSRILLVNLDALHGEPSKPSREFHVFNPTTDAQGVTVKVADLSGAGPFEVTTFGLGTPSTAIMTADALAGGTDFEIPAMAAARIRIAPPESSPPGTDGDWRTRGELSRTYAALQTSGSQLAPDTLRALTNQFLRALDDYHDARPGAQVAADCSRIRRSLEAAL